MANLLTIELCKDYPTGKYYIQFIDHTETTCDNKGYWSGRDVDEKLLTKLLKICYPEWDGEHRFRHGGVLPEQNTNCILLCDNKECENNARGRLEKIEKDSSLEELKALAERYGVDIAGRVP